ncbi:hypothetical protein ACLOJK_015198 [Asimina triloba]
MDRPALDRCWRLDGWPSLLVTGRFGLADQAKLLASFSIVAEGATPVDGFGPHGWIDAGRRCGRRRICLYLGRWLVRVAGWTQCCPPLAAHRRDLPSLAEASGGGDGSRILDLESGLHDLGHLPVMVMEPVKGLP